jgi:GNAT superfamily N-acetyltransferase
VRVREASPADLDALFCVQKAASTAAFAHVYPPDRYPYPDEAIRKEIARRLADEATTYLVAEDEGKGGEMQDLTPGSGLAFDHGDVVGFVSVSPGWVEQLYVLPDEQGRGIGSALLEAAVTRRRHAGDTELRLWTLESNEAGRRFYEARGWQPAKETRVVPYPPHPTDVSYVRSL